VGLIDHRAQDGIQDAAMTLDLRLDLGHLDLQVLPQLKKEEPQ
jgi:hypothetical protein